jgi:hypothetical protein
MYSPWTSGSQVSEILAFMKRILEVLILNYWVFGLFQSFGILETEDDSTSETGSVSVPKWGGETLTVFSPLEKPNFNHSTKYNCLHSRPHLRMETNPVSETLHSLVLLEYWTTAKVQRPSNPECYTPSSGPFSIYLLVELRCEVQIPITEFPWGVWSWWHTRINIPRPRHSSGG